MGRHQSDLPRHAVRGQQRIDLGATVAQQRHPRMTVDPIVFDRPRAIGGRVATPYHQRQFVVIDDFAVGACRQGRVRYSERQIQAAAGEAVQYIVAIGFDANLDTRRLLREARHHAR